MVCELLPVSRQQSSVAACSMTKVTITFMLAIVAMHTNKLFLEQRNPESRKVVAYLFSCFVHCCVQVAFAAFLPHTDHCAEKD